MKGPVYKNSGYTHTTSPQSTGAEEGEDDNNHRSPYKYSWREPNKEKEEIRTQFQRFKVSTANYLSYSTVHLGYVMKVN